jgi:hypothetical protein
MKATFWTDPWDGKQKKMERRQRGPRAAEPLPPGVTADAQGRWTFTPPATTKVAADLEQAARDQVRARSVDVVCVHDSVLSIGAQVKVLVQIHNDPEGEGPRTYSLEHLELIP